MNLTEKSILVIGGFSDVGLAILERLVAYGAKVIVVDEETNGKAYSEQEQFGPLPFHEVSVLETASITEKLPSILKQLPEIHGLIFASGTGGIRPLSMVKPNIMAKMVEANCISFVETVRLANRAKKLTQGSSIVAISSISSIMGLKSKLAYATSKAALNAAVVNLAAELAPKGIRVNAILKGVMSFDNDLSYVKDMYSLSDEIDTKQVLGVSQPAELGNLVSFLVSDLVTSITGTLLKMDGGYSL